MRLVGGHYITAGHMLHEALDMVITAIINTKTLDDIISHKSNEIDTLNI